MKLRCVILTGAGRAFSAGGNLGIIDERLKQTEELNRKEMVEFYSSFLCLRDIEIPTIAYINGPAIGAGFCIALACDLRVAVDTAVMGVNFTKLGLSPGMAGSWLITQLAGLPVAAELLFTGKTITASEAFAIGLVNQIDSEEHIEKAVQELAESIAANAPIAVRETKEVLLTNVTHSINTALENEAKAQARCFQTEDLAEGVLAIREKREPVFKGK